jgi:hypothetical protein
MEYISAHTVERHSRENVFQLASTHYFNINILEEQMNLPYFVLKILK